MEKTSPNTILLATATLAFGVLFAWNIAHQTEEHSATSENDTCLCACKDEDIRYRDCTLTGGGQAYRESDVARCVRNYRADLFPETASSFFISKKVIDQIFCGTESNGISIYIGQEDVEIDDKAVRIFFKGVKSKYKPAGVGSAQDYYYADTFCPSYCDFENSRIGQILAGNNGEEEPANPTGGPNP